jgi:hypothetical protein
MLFHLNLSNNQFKFYNFNKLPPNQSLVHLNLSNHYSTLFQFYESY